jgi:hypothetical protein
MDRKRISSIRFSDDDIAWLTERAEDEGVDVASFVRMLVTRVRKGRPAIATEFERSAPAVHTPLRVKLPDPEWSRLTAEQPVSPEDAAQAEYLLAERAAQAELSTAGAPEPEFQEAIGAAIPLRVVTREKYNPGRR